MRFTGVIIRSAETSDLEAVNRLLQEVLRVHHELRPDLFRPIGKKYTDKELTAIFANPETPVFVYEDSGEVQGYMFCQLQRSNPGSMNPCLTLYIDDLCIDPAHRRKGIAKALYDRALDFAREKGCHNVTLHVWEGNDSALSFYKRLGMKTQYTCLESVL